MKLLETDYLTDQGSLKNEFKPAAYLDSSILIDYFLTYTDPPFREMTEEEIAHNETMEELAEEYKSLVYKDAKLILKEFPLKKTKNKGEWHSVLVTCREQLLKARLKLNLVYSPISIIELSSWYTENIFKNLLAEIYPVKNIQKMGVKDLSEYLGKILKKVRIDLESKKNNSEKNNLPDSLVLLKQLVFGDYLWPKITDPEYNKHPDDPEYIPYPDSEPNSLRAFNGLIAADIRNFNIFLFPFKDFIKLYGTFAYLNIGTADILHLFLAKHLECQYLISKDPDFRNNKDEILSKLNIEIIGNPSDFERLVLSE